MKKIFLAISLIVMLFSLTGCETVTTSIDKYYYIIGLGIDEGDNNLLKISVQIAHSNSSESSSTSQSTHAKIYSVEGETINSCFTILNNYLNKQLNLSHCSALILSEKIARSDIEPIFSTLGNDTDLRGTCNVIVSSTTAYELLEKVSNSGEGFSSRLYDYLVNSSDYTGFSTNSEFSDIYMNMKDEYGQIYTIYASILENTVQNTGIAVFKNNRMVGSINVLDTISHLLVTSGLKSCILTFDSPFKTGEYIDMEITKLYKKTKTNISLLNNSPFIEVDIYPKCYITSSGKNYDYTQDSDITKLEKATDNYIKIIVNNYLYTITKEYDSDIAEFGKKFTANFWTLDDFKKIRWNEIFTNAFYKVNVHTKITSSKLFNKQ